ncbi:MAG: hypothetical protein KAJ28_11520 [Flavobacteriaceae bacterium]|nr:hypothetical protein [Flavobacteriaceae bacterium]
MKPYILSLTFILLYSTTISQNLTGAQLLDKAIEYHDPNHNWESFNGELLVTMETPNNLNRDSKIVINLPEDYFYVNAVRDTLSTEYTLDKGNCNIKFCGKSEFDDATAKTHRLSCERANMYKNYYTYLYGLPMKLKDNGTIIHGKVERKTFKGKEYLVLKATYDETVGSDTWYFYFDPETYAMEVYQFFHDEAKNDGEYILLTEEEIINGIKMPKNRAWYTNKENKYLGTDRLK